MNTNNIIKVKFYIFFATVNVQVTNNQFYNYIYSLGLQMLSSDGFWSDNPWIVGFKWFRLNESILACTNKLSLIICTSITDNDLRWVFIRHDDSGLWESASEAIGVIWFKGLFEHTCMKVVSYFELILGESSYFAQSLCIKVDWLWCSIVER